MPRGAFIVAADQWPAALAAGCDLVHWKGETLNRELMAAWFDVRSERPVMTYAVDEPDLQGITPEAARLLCERTRLPGLPTFTVIANQYRAYRDVADEIGVDIYPYTNWFPWNFWNAFNWFTLWQGRRQLARARAELSGKPWWGIAQAHSTSYLRMPSLAEFRTWERAFLEAGAKGVMAFAWGGGDHWRGSPDLIRAAWGSG